MQYLGFSNLTPFAAQSLLLADQQGRDMFTCVVKGTFQLELRGEGTLVALADEQIPVCVDAIHYGDPASSSVKYESETALLKLGTDVVLIGHAHATGGRATYLDVSVSVGPARSIVRVFGDRVWTTTAGRWTASDPVPFESMPLVYERAFGGTDLTSPDPAVQEFEPRNPVGVGFISKKYGTLREGAPLPNLENPYEPIASPSDRPTPAGFGFVGPHWQPRASYAGTYDEAWQKKRMPLLPADFDNRYYNAAATGLALNGFLRGGEPVEIVNAAPRGVLRFQLPIFEPYATVRMKDGATHRFGTLLDTVIVNTDENRLFMVWRGSLPIQQRVHEMLWSKAELAPGGRATQ